jgi:hypothetical protein
LCVVIGVGASTRVGEPRLRVGERPCGIVLVAFFVLAQPIEAPQAVQDGTGAPQAASKVPNSARHAALDAPATPEQKAKLKTPSPEAVKASSLAGEPIIAKLDHASAIIRPLKAAYRRFAF